jgi:thioesterase domain-containing protein
MVSGDWVPVPLGGALATELPGARLVSLGGATEASIWSNWFAVPRRAPAEWTSVPYGHPLANQRFRVLDDAMADRPDWVPGDLYIGGRGLADGYLDRPDLTAAAFVTHPTDGQRLYRTGDRACYWPDGTVEFLGRRDDQVKVNGFRVELGEVDAALSAQPTVRAAAAVLRRDDRGGTLVAHVVADPAGPGFEERLLAGLRGRLPDYLVPRSVLLHDRLPLTANGKVDRARLAALSPGQSGATAVVPAATATEERLLALWRTVVPARGVTDDFFHEGGHSLSAAALLNAVEREFGRRLPLTALYERHTVRELAPLLDRPDTGGPALVRLGGTGDPVVLIHPVGGDVLCYQPLVERLSSGSAVHGVSAGWAPDPDRDLTTLAAGYWELVADLFGDRPVRLAGWSFGAVVAYEMARLAVGAGRDCALVMLDPWLPAGPAAAVPEHALIRSFFHNLSQGRLDLSQDRFDEGGDRGLTDALATALAAVTARDPRLRGLTPDTVARLFGRYRDNSRALQRYRFRDEPRLRPAVVVASRGLGGGAADHLVPMRAAIGAAALPGAAWHPFDGDHFSMVDPGRTDDITTILREGLVV